jgi:hypothetical protein
MRRCTAYLLSQLGACLFGAPDNLLLLLNRKRLESGGIVHPLLHQHHASSYTGRSIGNECQMRTTIGKR